MSALTHVCLILLLCIVPQVAHAQTVTTFAGGGPDLSGLTFGGIDVASDGTMYFADVDNFVIYKLDSNGSLSIFAGTEGSDSFSGDGGQATDAEVSDLRGLAVDSSGNVYFVDDGNQRVRKVDTSGIITTVAGDGTTGYTGDGGQATDAQISSIRDVAVFSNTLYISDSASFVVRAVNLSTGIISTFAGDGSIGATGDGGAATAAELNQPYGLAVDSSGNLYIADYNNGAIRRVDTNGDIDTFAGQINAAGPLNDGGPATDAHLGQPVDVAIDGSDNLYILDDFDHTVRKVNSSGIINIVAGTDGSNGFSGDGGAATSAQLNAPTYLATTSGGEIWINDEGNARIRKVDSSGDIDTYLGDLNDNLQATSAVLDVPAHVTIDASGNIYLGSFAGSVRKIDSSGIITRFAGQHTSNFESGDGGPATDAEMSDASDMVADSAGNIYIADTGNDLIRVVNTSGTINTFAGDGTNGTSGDGGQATDAGFGFPAGLAIDSNDDVYISDGNSIRKVDASTGIITTFAGGNGNGYTGDGGQATDAQLRANVEGLYVDGNDDLYITDAGNDVIRKVDLSTGIITTVAGTGSGGYTGDGGQATLATLNNPGDVWVDASGNIFITDSSNDVVRKVDTSGIISTYASVADPFGVFGDSSGILYVASWQNNLVHKITPPITESTAAFGLSGESTVVSGGEVQIFGIGVTGNNSTTVSAVSLTIDAPSSGTIEAADFASLKFYKSSSSVLDGSATLLGTQTTVNIGTSTTITASSADTPPLGSETFYLASAVVSSTPGNSFTVAFPASGLTTSIGGLGSSFVGSDANSVTIAEQTDPQGVSIRLLEPDDGDIVAIGDSVIVQVITLPGISDLDTVIVGLSSGVGASKFGDISAVIDTLTAPTSSSSSADSTLR